MCDVIHHCPSFNGEPLVRDVVVINLKGSIVSQSINQSHFILCSATFLQAILSLCDLKGFATFSGIKKAYKHVLVLGGHIVLVVVNITRNPEKAECGTLKTLSDSLRSTEYPPIPVTWAGGVHLQRGRPETGTW